MKRISLTLVLLSILKSGLAFSAEEVLSAGVARIDITPPLEMGATLGGYGERMSKPALGVHDRVMAKALVIIQGKDRFALVTLDALGLPGAVKAAVVEKLAPSGWKADQILFLSSHSHASIEINAVNPNNKFPIPQIGLFQKDLFDFLVGRLAEVIEKAAKDPVPVAIGTASTNLEGWTHNRRKDNTAIDPVLTVTRIDKASGEPLAVLVNWASHPTFLGPEDMLFSGEWPGHLQRTLEALIGGGVTAMYSNGAEGDQAPSARQDSGDSGWEKAERYGLALGIEAHKVWEKVTPKPGGRFAYHLEPIELPKRTWHPDFMATGGKEYGLREEIMEGLLNDLSPAATTSGSLRLGDLVIVGVPGEMASGLGKDLKDKTHAATGAPQVVIGGLANEWISYILSPEEYTKGGYEASVSFYGAQLGPVISEGAVRGVASLK
jgi:hypothetical protein